MLPDKLFEDMDALIKLELRKVELLRQLKRGYMLANVIGQHPKQIKGSLSTRVYDYNGRLSSEPWRRIDLGVELNGKEVARKKLVDVPLELWPDNLRAAYERHVKRNRKETT